MGSKEKSRRGPASSQSPAGARTNTMSVTPEVLFMTWQDQASRTILPIGRILRTAEGYEFAYIRSALEAVEMGFQPLVTFPDFETVYRTQDLPPLLSNRVMRPSREDFPRFVAQLGLGKEAEPFTVLARSGGRRATDRLEVFAPPAQCDAGYAGLLLARGVRHMPGAEAAIARLTAGQPLGLEAEPSNTQNPHAQLIVDADGRKLGYLPNYLADELAWLGAPGSALNLAVEKVNLPPEPVHHRLLCSYTCPTDLGGHLFKSEAFTPISAEATRLAA